MSDIRPDPFSCRVAEPGLGLLQLIHGSFPDENTRCAAVAAEVFLRWQLGGRALTPGLPSVLLVSCSPGASDPVWELISRHRGADPFDGDRRAALNMMRGLLARHGHANDEGNSAGRVRPSEWRMAVEKGFGNARIGRYRDMWAPEIGLITGRGNDVVLRLDDQKDRKQFREDIQSNPERLLSPQGPNERLQVVPKMGPVAGTVPEKGWDQSLITHILAQGLPVIFLPHLAKTDSSSLGKLEPLLTSTNCVSPWEGHGQIVPTINLGRSPHWEWLMSYEGTLRTRSAYLPGGYQFFLLRTVRELAHVCLRIAAQVPHTVLSPQERFYLASDLFQMSLRALVAGVESLAYHCWGIAAGGPPVEMLRIMDHLRKNERTKHRSALPTGLDIPQGLVQLLLREGLVVKHKDRMVAVPLDQFLEGIPRRAGLPNLALYTGPLYRRLVAKRA